MAKAKAAEAPATSMWKPLPEEFFLEPDFTSIAFVLGLEIDQIIWTVTDEEQDGVAGHSLSGVPA